MRKAPAKTAESRCDYQDGTVHGCRGRDHTKRRERRMTRENADVVANQTGQKDSSIERKHGNPYPTTREEPERPPGGKRPNRESRGIEQRHMRTSAPVASPVAQTVRASDSKLPVRRNVQRYAPAPAAQSVARSLSATV